MRTYRRYFFDLDGTVHLSGHPVPGAAQTISRLRSRGAKVTFVSNNPLKSVHQYAQALQMMGIPAEAGDVFTSVTATVAYLARHHAKQRCYVIGEQPLIEALQAAGQPLTDNAAETDVVIVSWDRQFHYTQLNTALQAVRRGAVVIATHPDRTCPVAGGEIADAGGMIGAVEGVTGRKIEVICGKPFPLMLELALSAAPVPPDECIMIGDRYQTDITMGKRAGLATALVLTGGTRPEDVPGIPPEAQPQYVLRSVADLLHEEDGA